MGSSTSVEGDRKTASVHYLTVHEKDIVAVIEGHIKLRVLFLPSDMSMEVEGAASAVPTLNPKSVILVYREVRR